MNLTEDVVVHDLPQVIGVGFLADVSPDDVAHVVRHITVQVFLDHIAQEFAARHFLTGSKVAELIFDYFRHISLQWGVTLPMGAACTRPAKMWHRSTPKKWAEPWSARPISLLGSWNNS